MLPAAWLLFALFSLDGPRYVLLGLSVICGVWAVLWSGGVLLWRLRRRLARP